jgi:hypothetical protein
VSNLVKDVDTFLKEEETGTAAEQVWFLAQMLLKASSGARAAAVECGLRKRLLSFLQEQPLDAISLLVNKPSLIDYQFPEPKKRVERQL